MMTDEALALQSRRFLAAYLNAKYSLPVSVHPRGICISESDYSALRAAILREVMSGRPIARDYYFNSQPIIVTPDWAHKRFTVATLRLRATIRAGLRTVRRAARGRSC